MAETAVNRPSGGWPKRFKIPKSQVADFGWVAIHIMPLLRRSVGYSQLTDPAGDNEYQYATGFQPAIGVAQERLLGAATVSQPQCPVIRWIKIKQPAALDCALHFEGIALDYVRNPLPGLLSAIGIKLNTVAKDLSTVGDNLERHAIASTWVDRGRRIMWKPEEPANPLGFGQGQRVETKPTFALKAQGGSFLRETRMCDLKHKVALSVTLCFKMLSRTQFLRGFAVDTHYDYSMLVQGFVPVVCKNAGMVILGTLPGRDSLRLRQYYADPGNAFWFIVGKLFGIIGTYDECVQGLIKNRIAIWDVLERAERSGSLDKKIVKGTEVPNDFTAFFRTHPSIKTVFFNGRPAEKYFRDLVVPGLHLGAGAPRFCPALPSTSRTNSHATKEAKAESWGVVQLALAND